MNTPVSFPLAKLLKEKGYDKQTEYFYTKPRSKVFGIDEHGRYYPIKNKPNNLYIIGNAAVLNESNAYSAPNIAEVVMWLYEKHGIWIQAPFSHNDPKPFCWTINTTKRNISEEDENRNCWLSGIDNDNVDGHNSPTEAYEAAIEYTLNNLI